MWVIFYSVNKLGGEPNASILYEMSYQEGNERSQKHNHEERETSDTRRLPLMRDKNVPDREELIEFITLTIYPGSLSR